MSSRILAAAFAAVLLLAPGSPARAGSIPSPEWCDVVEVQSGGFERAALIHLPKGYENSDKRYPVVFMFHGGDGSAKQAASWWSNWKNEEVILVFPNGQTEVPQLAAWSPINGDPQQHVQFVRDLVEQLDADYRIDPERRFAVGFSHGGFQTFKLFCFASDLFAGFTVVSQTLNLEDAKQCRPGGKPILYMIGDEDAKSFWHGRPGTMTVDQTVRFLLDQGGCSDEKTVEVIDQPGDRTRVRRARFADCRRTSSVEFMHIEGGDHSWPGRDKDKPGQCRDIDAAEVALDFWKRAAEM